MGILGWAGQQPATSVSLISSRVTPWNGQHVISLVRRDFPDVPNPIPIPRKIVFCGKTTIVKRKITNKSDSEFVTDC